MIIYVQNCHKYLANNWCFFYERLKISTGRCYFVFLTFYFFRSISFSYGVCCCTRLLFLWRGWFLLWGQVDEILLLLFVVIKPLSVTFTCYLLPVTIVKSC